MPSRAGPALMASLAPSLEGSSPATAMPSVADWAISEAAASDNTVSDAAVSRTGAGREAADARPADDWPTDDGPADEGPGLVVSWTGGVTIGQVLSAADRYQRHRAGLDLPAWGEVGHAGQPDDPPAGDPGPGPQDDELAEEAVRAAPEDRGRVLSVAALGGHAIMAPGPDLAGWLACGRATERDDAALVTSITAWRKVTSWAQAQELAAVAELARRRRVAEAVDAGGQDRDRAVDAGDCGPVADAGRGDPDPVAELEAGFAPNAVALALTLTQGGAEYWMDLAVNLTRRLPATLTALGEGAIDLNRAKLIDQHQLAGRPARRSGRAPGADQGGAPDHRAAAGIAPAGRARRRSRGRGAAASGGPAAGLGRAVRRSRWHRLAVGTVPAGRAGGRRLGADLCHGQGHGGRRCGRGYGPVACPGLRRPAARDAASHPALLRRARRRGPGRPRARGQLVRRRARGRRPGRRRARGQLVRRRARGRRPGRWRAGWQRVC